MFPTSQCEDFALIHHKTQKVPIITLNLFLFDPFRFGKQREQIGDVPGNNLEVLEGQSAESLKDIQQEGAFWQEVWAQNVFINP